MATDFGKITTDKSVVDAGGVYEAQSAATPIFGESGIWYGSTPFTGSVNGNPTSTSIVYNVTAGENSIMPGQVIHNTTKGERVLITAVNYGTNTLTVEANSPDDSDTWDNTDVLTTASQTNAGRAGIFVDIDVTPHVSGAVTGCVLASNWVRRNADDHFIVCHPYEAYDVDKELVVARLQDDTTHYEHWIQPLGVADSRYYFTMCLLVLAADNGAGLARLQGQFSQLVT